MRKFFITIFIFCGINTIYSQKISVLDISDNIDANYVFANIYWNEITKEKLSSTLIVVLKQADPRNTPEDYFDGTDEVLSNLLISLSTTGEYSKSKLYKIPHLNNPKVLKIKEDIHAGKITVTINYRDKQGKIYKKDLHFERIF